MLDEACPWRRPLSFNILFTGGKQTESENPNRNQHEKNEFDRTKSDINTEWDLCYDILGYGFYPNRIRTQMDI